ncbi:hypothetical protein QU894_29485, partial [Citrobacter freundii]|uniref:hypothetical protein n=1 Tax=Citrobacter freundii TaxID=546 RepID=UPI0038BD9B15
NVLQNDYMALLSSINIALGYSPTTSWQIDGISFSWAPKSLQTVTAAMKLKDACSLEERLWQTYTVY